MISYDDALTRMLGTVRSLDSEWVDIDQASGRVLAQDVLARIDAPRADVSAMDGYAVQLATAAQGDWLTLAGVSAAGAPFAGPVGSDQAVRIFTGAHVPAGADAVIMQEYAELRNDQVRFRPGFGPARHVRTLGSDFRNGDRLLEKGQRLTGRAVVTLAGADLDRVRVSRRPSIAILATGDELERPGMAHRSAHGLPESGSYGVAAMARSYGATVVDQSRGPDDIQVLSTMARRALEMADCVVVIGGASVGDRDLARPAFADTELQEVFAKVALKPGKPVWFGRAGDTAVLGLPGNPTSAMVTARLFLAPLLIALQGGCGRREVEPMPQVLAGELAANGSRETFMRATGTPDGLVPAINQESGAQAPLAQSDWLIRRKPGEGALQSGSLVPAMRF